jgi:hypothetical protein
MLVNVCVSNPLTQGFLFVHKVLFKKVSKKVNKVRCSNDL